MNVWSSDIHSQGGLRFWLAGGTIWKSGDHPLGTMNIKYSNCHNSNSNSCSKPQMWMSFWCQIKAKGSSKSVRLNIWGPWMSLEHVMSIHPVVASLHLHNGKQNKHINMRQSVIDCLWSDKNWYMHPFGDNQMAHLTAASCCQCWTLSHVSRAISLNVCVVVKLASTCHKIQQSERCGTSS